MTQVTNIEVAKSLVVIEEQIKELRLQTKDVDPDVHSRLIDLYLNFITLKKALS